MPFGWEGEKVRLTPLDKAKHLDNALVWMNDPEVTAWALMAAGEMLGMRYILWGDGSVPADVEHELARIIRCVLEAK